VHGGNARSAKRQQIGPATTRDLIFQAFATAAFTRSGVIGNCSRRAPTASKMALANPAPRAMIAGSPPPSDGVWGFSTRTISIFGSYD
jgi:hypothetical protein